MREDKKQKIYRTIMLIIMVAVITFVATLIFMKGKVGGTKYVMLQGSSDYSSLTSKLSSFKGIIDKSFLGEVDEKKLEEYAIKGYIAGLNDDYSEYYTKEEMDKVKENTAGSFNGIGIYFSKDTSTGEIVVLSPIEDSAADKAGILPADIIKKVNGEDVTGMDIYLVSNKIKGDPGTSVTLEILRKEETFTIELNRENVIINPVKAEIKDGNIGYLKITSFDENTAEVFKSKYDEIKKQGIKGLIIDLRNNGGGIVNQATDIADMFVEKDKTTLITVDKNEKEVETKSKNDPIINEKVVVLVNENTASASEILAGCLKDLERATIVGTKTYGKGVIQELMSFKDGSGLKITTEEYLTPNRNRINKVGIEPDEEVKLPDDVKNTSKIEEEKDTQLQKAIDILKNL